MKTKLYSSFCAAILVFTAASCSSSPEESLKVTVAATQADLPIDLGAVGTFDSIDYDEDVNAIRFGYTLNEDLNNIDSMSKNNIVTKNSIEAFLRSQTAKPMLDQMAEAGASLEATFKGSHSEKTCTITFPAEEIRKLSELPARTQEENDLDQIRAMVETANAECPIDLGDGMIQTSVKFEDGFTVYSYEITGSEYDFEARDMPLMKRDLRTNLAELYQGPVGENIKELFFRSKTGIRYVFKYNDNGETYTIDFSPAEIRRL